MVKNNIRITIVDDSKGEKCGAHCGVDWSLPEVITFASHRIRDRFGDKVHLEYLDLSKSITTSYGLELSQEIRIKNLSLPLLLIDGKTKISGQFDIRMLLDAIGVEMELGKRYSLPSKLQGG
ncbi:hypothetical protein ACFL4C_02955 [Candidatus Omnitrophota bacterium]